MGIVLVGTATADSGGDEIWTEGRGTELILVGGELEIVVLAGLMLQVLVALRTWVLPAGCLAERRSEHNTCVPQA